MRQPSKTTVSLAVAQLLLISAGASLAQQADNTPKAGTVQSVVISGQRRALETAQEIKRTAEEIVDSVVAEEAGKLPDRSLTEVLQRVVGVTVQRQRNTFDDAAHYSEENSGIRVRGLSWGSSNLNGREVFSAGWPGRDLSWGAIPSELMSRVDVYKNPSAERIEGAISGLVDLRTALPFDYKGTKSVLSAGLGYETSTGKLAPSLSGLYSKQWESESGRWGALVDLSTNTTRYASTSFGMKPWFPLQNVDTTNPTKRVWAPTGFEYSDNDGKSDRTGFYGALQWRKNNMSSTLTALVSKSVDRDQNSGLFSDAKGDAYNLTITNPVINEQGIVTKGDYSMLYAPGGVKIGGNGPNKDLPKVVSRGANTNTYGGIETGLSRVANEHHTQTSDVAWNFKWDVSDRLQVENDVQWVRSEFQTEGREIQLGTFLRGYTLEAAPSSPAARVTFSPDTIADLANPENYFWNVIQPKSYRGEAEMFAWKVDGRLKFDDPVIRDLRFGARTAYRKSKREEAFFDSDPSGTGWASVARSWSVPFTEKPGELPKNVNVGTLNNHGLDGFSPGSFAFLKNGTANAQVGPTELFSFNGKSYTGQMGNLPPVVQPSFAFIKDYPNAYTKVMQDVRYNMCRDTATQLNGSITPQQLDAACPRASFDFNPQLGYYDPSIDYNQTSGNANGNALAASHTSSASEHSLALYGTLRFGFDDWKIPVDGNVGLRAIYTRDVAHGYISFSPLKQTDVTEDVPLFDSMVQKLDVSNTRFDMLPSLNLRFDLGNRLQARVAASKGMYRPDFRQLQESITLKQNRATTEVPYVTYTGENQGNVKLKPVTSQNFDLALEWNPKSGQQLYGTVFYKKVTDIILKTSYQRTYESKAGLAQYFLVSGPANAASGHVRGIELGGETYFDKVDWMKPWLPELAKGFGVSANYTYIDSRQTLYQSSPLSYCPKNGNQAANTVLLGCDTNGLPFASMPIQGLAKNAYNVALRYDKDGLSARLAYTWNGRSLKDVAAFGSNGGNGVSADPARPNATDSYWALGRWQEAYGQLDGSVSYTFNDRFSVSLQVSNLNNVKPRETNAQTIGATGHKWYFPGRSYYLTTRLEF